MNIAIVAPNTNVKSWEKQFNLNSSSVNISIWPNIDNYDDIDCVCLWKHPKGMLNKFKNIKLIYSKRKPLYLMRRLSLIFLYFLHIF